MFLKTIFLNPSLNNIRQILREQFSKKQERSRWKSLMKAWISLGQSPGQMENTSKCWMMKPGIYVQVLGHAGVRNPKVSKKNLKRNSTCLYGTSTIAEQLLEITLCMISIGWPHIQRRKPQDRDLFRLSEELSRLLQRAIKGLADWAATRHQ